MKKEFKGAGKGKRPIVGYNPKNWYSNFDEINWGPSSHLSSFPTQSQKEEALNNFRNNVKSSRKHN